MIKEIKTSKFEGLAVLVPDDKNDISAIDLVRLINDREEYHPDERILLLGKSTELTEEQYASIVSQMKDSSYPFEIEEYKITFENYMQSIGAYSVNPYGEKPEFVFNQYGKSPDEFNRFELDQHKWKEAEESTGIWLILEKIKQ